MVRLSLAAFLQILFQKLLHCKGLILVVWQLPDELHLTSSDHVEILRLLVLVQDDGARGEGARRADEGERFERACWQVLDDRDGAEEREALFCDGTVLASDKPAAHTGYRARQHQASAR